MEKDVGLKWNFYYNAVLGTRYASSEHFDPFARFKSVSRPYSIISIISKIH